MSLCIVHLSDIHIRENSSANPVISRASQLCNACNSVITSADDVIIIISGDIAYSGKPQEYELAIPLIDDLQNQLQKQGHIAKVIMVPGNHDCDFPSESSIRDALIESIKVPSDITDSIQTEITKVQRNFEVFSDLFHKFDISKLCNTYTMNTETNKFLFLLINTAWMSQLHDIPGKLLFPESIFNSPIEEYDCVFTVMHHPDNWINPDYRDGFLQYLRNTTDVLLCGHEHRKDSFKISGDSWSIEEFYEGELQNKEDSSSSFAIYRFDQPLQNIETYSFIWDGNLYRKKSENVKTFIRNTRISKQSFTPSPKYMSEYILDPGMLITHANAENIRLPEIFCYPHLDRIDMPDNDSMSISTKITDNIPQVLASNSLSIVVGDSLSGKSALAKMLFYEYTKDRTVCLLLDGSELETIVESNLRRKIEECFINEYSPEMLERYSQLSPDERILIVDNVDSIRYRDERRSRVISHLTQYAARVILFMENGTEANLMCSRIANVLDIDIQTYQICYFNNIKRHELIKRWYSLRNNDSDADMSTDETINVAVQKINTLLGVLGGIVPAVPAYLLCFLQNLDSVTPASFSGSQFGFLYDSLINKSLSSIKYTSAGAHNIDISIISNLAYQLLKENCNSFSDNRLQTITDMFSHKMKVDINAVSLRNKILKSRLIKEIGPSTYKFRYPYIFYYFAGRYIAYNLKDADVQRQLSYMSERLHNEVFGNIVIFVCHFANNIQIIEDILTVAMVSLESYDEFDLDKHTDIFDKARGIINRLVQEFPVGSDSDVENHLNNKLAERDQAGIQDGSVCDNTGISGEEKTEDEYLASLSTAMRTLDVLGQIIMNYPGDIDGSLKLTIIETIHKLGMRVTEALLKTIEEIEEDFILYLLKQIQDSKKVQSIDDIVEKVQEMFSLIIANMTMSMIRKIAASLNCNELLPAIQETFENSCSISHKLILQDLQLNLLHRPDYYQVCKLKDEFTRDKKLWFAEAVLSSIVAYYLRNNKCGYTIRDQLCTKFGFSPTRVLIEGEKSERNK